MEKLSLFLLPILILGCGTETTVVEEPPIIEEPAPVVASGERFWLSPIDPVIVAGTIADGENNVNPEPINAGGVRFDFNEPLKLHKIDILHDGKSLWWIGAGISEGVTQTLRLTPVAGQELQFDTEYVIKIYVQDLACQGFRFKIRFRTMPEP